MQELHEDLEVVSGLAHLDIDSVTWYRLLFYRRHNISTIRYRTVMLRVRPWGAPIVTIAAIVAANATGAPVGCSVDGSDTILQCFGIYGLPFY